jgi:hypothetical protein
MDPLDLCIWFVKWVVLFTSYKSVQAADLGPIPTVQKVRRDHELGFNKDYSEGLWNKQEVGQ